MLVNFEGIEFIDGGLCASKGFKASGVHCGIRKNQTKKDLALIYSETICQASAVYTQNLVKGAPIQVCKENLADGKAQAIIVNSGNANTCNADGEIKARMMCDMVAKALNVDTKDVIVASTGVIGQVLDVTPIETSMDTLVSQLRVDGNSDAAEAILTTDTKKKEFAIKFKIGDTTCHIGGMAKGSGMIHPNMATMLSFLTTDVNITDELLAKALKGVVDDTFNMVSVDGDTSTNDTCAIMANATAGNTLIDNENSDDYKDFYKALFAILVNISREIAADGEGATKLLECSVFGAIDICNAKKVAKSVITSSLFKCAMFGKDANWGRILCAIGYSNAELNINAVDVLLSSKVGTVEVCKDGAGVDFSEDEALKILQEEEIKIIVNLHDGDAYAVAWGCDLTYDYVQINGDYRS